MNDQVLKAIKPHLGDNTYKAFIEMSKNPEFFVLSEHEKADLEMMELLDEDLDPEIIKIACLNKLTGTLEKALELGYVFTPEESELLK